MSETQITNPYHKPSSLAFTIFEQAKKGTTVKAIEKACEKAGQAPGRILRELRLEKFRGFGWTCKESADGTIKVHGVKGKFTSDAQKATKKTAVKAATKVVAKKADAKVVTKKVATKPEVKAAKTKATAKATAMVLMVISPSEVMKRMKAHKFASYKALTENLKLGEKVSVREEKKGKARIMEVTITTDGWQLEEGAALPE